MQLNFLDADTGLTGQFEAGKPAPVAPLARTSDPPSSKRAAWSFTQSGAMASHEETLVWCSDSIVRDWTAHELAVYSQRTGSPLDSVQITRRIKALREKNLLEQCPERQCTCGCEQVMGTHRSKREEQ